MLERYTKSARWCLADAEFRAAQCGSPVIETEHLLSGLLSAGEWQLRLIVHRWHVSLASIEEDLRSLMQSRRQLRTAADIAFSVEAGRVLDCAADEAARLQHNDIDVAHLLLGLLRVRGSAAATLLAKHGLDLLRVRAAVRASKRDALRS